MATFSCYWEKTICVFVSWQTQGHNVSFTAIPCGTVYANVLQNELGLQDELVLKNEPCKGNLQIAGHDLSL